MTTLPAVVTIVDLPLATTLSTAAVFEAVQTTNGVAESVKVNVLQIITSSLGGLPTGGATGQLLTKSTGSDFATQWANISSLISANATSGLVISGSTTLTASLATVAGLSALGVAATATAGPAPIVGAAAQVLRVNDAGTLLGFGAVNLASSVAVTGVLPASNVTATNLAASGAGGVQGVLPVANGGSGTSTLTAFGVVFGNGTSVVGITAAGNATSLLRGSATAPVFGTISSLLDAAVNATQGSLLYRNAATWVALAGATTGFILQTQGTAANPQWVGGMVLLNTLSPSNVATVGDITSLTSTYRNYLVTFDNIVPATSIGVVFQMQVATTGTAFISGGYVSWMNHVIGGAGANTSSTTAIQLNGSLSTTTLGNGTTYGLSGFVRLFNPSGTTSRKYIVGETAWLNGTTSQTGSFGYGIPTGYYDGNSNAITGLQFAMTTGNIQTGTIKIYGMP